MNSIQDLILKGDVENSYSYVTTFSNLVRSTLKYSEKDFIDFEKRTGTVAPVLVVEKVFEDELEYVITNMGDEDIQLPPLLIQRFCWKMPVCMAVARGVKEAIDSLRIAGSLDLHHRRRWHRSATCHGDPGAAARRTRVLFRQGHSHPF